jgi:hypothetical protein
VEQLEKVRLPEMIFPTFSIAAQDVDRPMLISIRRADIADGNKVILRDVNLLVMTGEELQFRVITGVDKRRF